MMNTIRLARIPGAHSRRRTPKPSRRRLSLIAPLAMLAGLMASGSARADGALQLTASAFADQSAIPALYTCEGRDLAPALRWSGVPAGAKSLALIVEDPDAPDPAAPQRIWVHWVVYNLPATANGLPEGVTAATLPAGAREGLNDWQHAGYGGPCPPIGRHRYVHRLYALDTVLPELDRTTRQAVVEAMQGHILDSATLTGTYRKQSRHD